jgi:mono/diheme cytochrome c family protein
MIFARIFLAAAVLVFATGIFSAVAQTSNIVATAPVFVPNTTHQNDPLPDGIIAWDGLMKTTNATAEQSQAEFTFCFTNITTNILTVLNVRPGCHCTTAELPPTPWSIPAGSNGTFKARVDLNITGHTGTLFKRVTVTTDQGTKDLMMRIDFLPAPVIKMSDAQKAAGIAAAKVDRQAVFKSDCASCHAKNLDGRYGQELYQKACAICHEAENRATVVPDLGKLTVPTNEDFWRTWITYGKPGSLMPAFAQSQGGPLNDMQIASLAQYLNALHPSAAPAPASAK